MATLSLWNYFSLPSNGVLRTGKQGTTTDAPQTPLDVTIPGTGIFFGGTLVTATPRLVYDDSVDFPVAFDYMHYWCSVNSYIQLIFGATNVILPVLAKVPFVLGPLAANLVGLAAANTTPMTGTEPTLTDLDKVYVSQWSGSTANFTFALVD